MTFIWVGLGGFFGAMARYAVGRVLAPENAQTDSLLLSQSFPVATLLVNSTGSFLIGVLAILPWFVDSSGTARLFLLTGFLGAFTTFSTFSLETLQLFQSGYIAKTVLNAGLNLVLCLLFVWIGASLGKVLMSTAG